MAGVESEVKEYLNLEELKEGLKRRDINARQLRAVKYLQKRGQIQSHEYAERLKCSRDTAVRDLKELVDKGIVETQGFGPQLRYVLKS